jgi:hypothetical protein
VLPHLTAHRGKLLSGSAKHGVPVHAATFIRRRRIVLETQLLPKPLALRLIVVHELFHFVWVRLSNRARSEFAALLQAEQVAAARGELGESSAAKKAALVQSRHKSGTLLWRDYVCESFCDTAAWLYSGIEQSEDFTLARRWRERRRVWFAPAFSGGCNC